MSRRTPGMPDHCDDNVTKVRRPSDPAADRLATLAALTMSRQNPGLVLPSLRDIPTSYNYTESGDNAVKLARSLALLGLGSPEVWEIDNGNLSTFSRNALNEWLKSVGASELQDNVWFDFAIVDSLDTSYGDSAASDGKLFILLETSDGAGFITVGEQIEELEKEKQGLGRAFYIVLMNTLYSWMQIYDIRDAEIFAERWRENIEMDMQSSSGDSGDESFTKYCVTNDIAFPDIEGATPACLRECYPHRKADSPKRCISLLRQHRHGKYGEWIEPVLAMAAVKQTKRVPSDPKISSASDDWFDEGPLPSWIVAFSEHDPVTQAFDEESQSLNEYTHAPVWLEAFDPADVNDVRRLLTHVQRFIEVNRNLVRLKNAFEKGVSRGSTSISELDDELRAA
jgi:hypothetical protein